MTETTKPRKRRTTSATQKKARAFAKVQRLFDEIAQRVAAENVRTGRWSKLMAEKRSALKDAKAEFDALAGKAQEYPSDG